MAFEDVKQAHAHYRAKLNTGKIITLISVLLGVLLGVALFSVAGPVSFVAAFFCALLGLIIGIIITALLTNKPRQAYQKAYKAHFVACTLEKTFKNLHYDHKAGLPKAVLKESSMINTADAYSSNDLTLGTYKNVKFAQADATIQQAHTDSDGNTTYVTIFKGRILLFEFRKKFAHRLELIGKRFHAFKVPGKNPTTHRKMQKISTESTDFNKTFKIYAEDGFETFYLLDPATIEKLQAIATRYNGKVLFGFVENTLLVAIDDGKDSFEPPRTNKPLDESAEQAKVDQDIKMITDFVDLLSLDHKLFIS